MSFLALSAVAFSAFFGDFSAVGSEDIGVLQEGLYTQTTQQYPKANIPVCWLRPTLTQPYSDEVKRLMDAVRVAVTNAYEKNTALHLAGWGYCADTNADYSSGIQISIQGGRPHTIGIGKENAGRVNMVLNFSYTTWDANCPLYYGLDACVTWAAVHEFGHALSAYHEQQRPDTPADCTNWLLSLQQDATDPITVTGAAVAKAVPGWDFKSVMNYCNESGFSFNGTDYGRTYNLLHENGGVLSPNDVKNFGSLYGYSKMSFDIGTAHGVSENGISFSFFNPSITLPSGQPYTNPDLYQIIWGQPTGSGKVEVHATSGSSLYKNFFIHSDSAIPWSTTPYLYGYSMADFDGDRKPDLYYFQVNPSTGFMEVHILGGSTGFRGYILHAQLPLPASFDWKFTFGDSDGDSIPDIFAVRATDDNTANIVKLTGKTSYTNGVSKTFNLTSAKAVVSGCHLVAGNFYGNTVVQTGADDLICMYADPTSRSTPVKIIPFTKYFSPWAYTPIDTQLSAEDGYYMDFGVWRNGPGPASNRLNGDNFLIGYIKRTNAPNTEIHFMNSALYL